MDSETQRTDALYEFLSWFEKNKKRVAIGGGVLLLVLGIVATATWMSGQKERQASERLSAIRLPLSPAEPLPADAVQQLKKLAADYAGTAAGRRAELICASVLYSQGKYAEAQAAFDKFLREHAESRWVGQAYYGVAVCLDAQNKVAEAVAKYEDFARRFSSDPNIDQARLNLGVLYEAVNRPGDALKEYDKIANAMSMSPAQGEAQERKRRLVAKHPELVPPPTNRPPVTATAPPTRVVATNAAPATNLPLIRITNAPPPPPAPPAK